MQGKNQRAASANIAFAAYQDQISEKQNSYFIFAII